MVGNSLSHYVILEELGRGGMGIVYKAEDTKLDRTVAIKVLPPAALASEDDRARFYREAKAAAQLHHQNIASVFEIDEAVPADAPHGTEASPFIAMEFIEGETLQERIANGPLKLGDAIQVAVQVASALGLAHDKNIVHRDIKSGNIMMAANGDAKILDFGLAQTAQSTKLTRMGSTVGTIAYMSPEQARGEEVDLRTDLWSLGVVLYEMISGKYPFPGDYEQAVVYSIINNEPEPLTAIRTGVPMQLEWIVNKLLAKSADDRYQSTSELQVDLRKLDLQETNLQTDTTTLTFGSDTSRTSSTRRILPWLLSLLLGIALISSFFGGKATEQSTGTAKRIVQPIPVVGGVSVVDISPQGDKVAFATDVIRVLDLTTGEITPYDVSETFVMLDFSNDGEHLLVTTAAGIKRMSLSTGSVVTVIETREGGPRAEWRNDDYIVFEENQTVYGMSITSSEPRQIISLDSLKGEYDLDYPHVLPGGNTLMATVEIRDAPSRIGFWDIESGRNLGYLDYPGYRAQWLDGYLVFVQEEEVMALPFDLRELEQTGPIIQVERQVRPAGLSVSNDGTLVHVGTRIGVTGTSGPVIPVVLRHTNSSVDNISGMDRFQSAVYRSGVVSPDGNRAAVVVEQLDDRRANALTDIWMLDFANWSRRKLTLGGTSDYPAWNVSGDSVYFVDSEGNGDIKIVPTTGSGVVQVVETAFPDLVDLTVSPDGKMAVFGTGPANLDDQSRMVIWPINTDDLVINLKTGIFVDGPNGNPRQYRFSPDGRYIAYEDQGAIFVQSIENTDSPPHLVWENSMSLPQWSHDSKVLYAFGQDGVPSRIDIQTDPVFATNGTPTRMINLASGARNLFDVFPDGERFLTAFPDPDAQIETVADSLDITIDLHFIINLPSELANLQ